MKRTSAIIASLMALAANVVVLGAASGNTSAKPWQLTRSQIAVVSVSDSEPSQRIWQPKNPSRAALELVKMLAVAEPADRKLPPSAKATFFAYVGPAVVSLALHSGGNVRIYPLYTLQKTKTGTYVIRYQAGTIVYKTKTAVKDLYDPPLYRWLRRGGWRSAFRQS